MTAVEFNENARFKEAFSWLDRNTALEYQRLLAETCMQSAHTEALWVEHLQRIGISAAHPDDGWVNREKNILYLQYPYFVLHDFGIGKYVALGGPEKYRIVLVTGQVPHWFLSKPRWTFRGIATISINCENPPPRKTKLSLWHRIARRLVALKFQAYALMYLSFKDD